MDRPDASGPSQPGRFRGAKRWLTGRPAILVGLLLLIWVGLPLLPEGTGLRFGVGYLAFFTAMLLLGALFFWFLGRESIPAPRRPAALLASLGGVFLLTVGLLVAAGVVYPQFPRPQPPGAAAQEAAGRGKELFWSDSIGCFRCHSIGRTGGTRGPDLTQVAVGAGERVPGLTAEQYLLEKITAGATYQFKVPEYAPIMPPFGKILTEEEVKDLVAYLMSLKGE